MKLKFFLSVLSLMILIANEANCQYFEFAKLLGDTGNKHWIGAMKQLNGNQLLIAGGYYKNQNEYGNILYKTNKNGDTLFTRLFKLNQVTAAGIAANGKYDISISTPNHFLVHHALLDSGYIKLLRFSCDSVGNNSYIIYNKYVVKSLDSVNITHPDLRVKYIPNECFYIYGQSPYAPDSSYVIWKLDTSGKLLWRQDYFDTCNGVSFNLTVFKNKLLLTSSIYNTRMSGARLIWMDTNGVVIKENTVSAPLIKANLGINNSQVLLSDTSIIMGFYRQGWDNFPWPLLIKFDAKLDTVWHRYMSFPRAKNHIDKSNDENYIVKMVATVDNNIGIYCERTFTDYSFGMGYGDNLRTYAPNGSLVSKISTDSIYHFGLPSYTDMISTSDKGFALTGRDYISAKKQCSYLLKLSNTVISNIEEPIEIGGGIKMYPNPARDRLNLISNAPLESATINLYNMQGELVQSYPNYSGSSLIINRGTLVNGLYLLKIQTGKGEQFLKKIIFE